VTAMIPILLYHSISDSPRGRFASFTVSRATFWKHLDRLVELGFTTVTVGQLIERRSAGDPLPHRTAVITVDDGFADFADAWPELTGRGLNATLYVTAAKIGETSRWLAPLRAGDVQMLSAAQLQQLAADGCEIGAHSLTHPQLDCLSLAAASAEIRQSKIVLEQILGQPVDTFAYPYGYHSRAVKQLVVAAGYTSATAVRNSVSHGQDDPYALARVTVMSDFSADRIERVLSGRQVPTARPGERLRTRLWRQVRRRKLTPQDVFKR
jgi:peptidoglycan/xylan/chitin deacetylase (PgdA/CDA1 family)